MKNVTKNVGKKDAATNKFQEIILSDDEDNDKQKVSEGSSLPVTPGYNIPITTEENNVNNKDDHEDTIPWFRPLSDEREIPLTPGRANHDIYSPPCCSHQRLLDSMEFSIPEFEEMEEIFRTGSDSR